MYSHNEAVTPGRRSKKIQNVDLGAVETEATPWQRNNNNNWEFV